VALIAIHGGLRISEVMNLEFNDITFLNNGSVKNSEKLSFQLVTVVSLFCLALGYYGVEAHPPGGEWRKPFMG